MTTLGRRVGHRRARLIAPASLLPDTGLCHLFSLANSKWLYRHLSVARASSVKRQGAPRAVLCAQHACRENIDTGNGLIKRSRYLTITNTTQQTLSIVMLRVSVGECSDSLGDLGGLLHFWSGLDLPKQPIWESQQRHDVQRTIPTTKVRKEVQNHKKKRIG
ncbi:jg11051 [Pararge aegeria aegeria]|uniref:Jg11051 protein n=1 Tax=Pararge aegeria aegeria TaxID=348720 RepID=A0A8S4R541_9NEOP|nr:jg11051 [Pararge aegeria aegeria]